jgi:DNA-binding response OmpR family regulator
MKILIIEDDSNIVEAITIAFQLRWPDVEVVSTPYGEKGIEIVGNEDVDIVVLDLSLPDISGFDVLKQIRLFSDVPVVILTVMSEESSIVKGLERGADDYIIKPVSQLQLLARVKALMRRTTTSNKSPLTVGPLKVIPSTAQVFCHDKEVNLTPTEFKILYCIMKHKGSIVSHSTLVKTVWDDDYPGAIDCIKVYIRRLRSKIELNPSDPKIILTKPGLGHIIASGSPDEG